MQEAQPHQDPPPSIHTRPLLPSPALCRGKLVSHPHAVQCLVEWPIYCIYAAKVGDRYFCGHRDRLAFTGDGQATL